MDFKRNSNPYILTEEELYETLEENNQTPKIIEEINLFRRESSPFSREKIKPPTKEKKVEFDLPTKKSPPPTLVEDLQADDPKTQCEDHPEEELQFYSFTHEKALCPECLLSGVYTGSEVVSLKKAADKIKPKFHELLDEVVEKTAKFQQFEEDLTKKKEELDDFARDIQVEVIQGMRELKETIDKKEKEIFAKITKTKQEKQDEVEKNLQSVQLVHKEFTNLRETLQAKLMNLKDLELCQYYLGNSKEIRAYIDKESYAKTKELKPILHGESLRNQFTLQEYQEGIARLIESLQNLKGMQLKEVLAPIIAPPKFYVETKPEPKVEPKIETRLEAKANAMESRIKDVIENVRASNNNHSRSFHFENIEEEESLFETTIQHNYFPKRTRNEETKNDNQHRSVSPFRSFQQFEDVSPLEKVPQDDGIMSPTDDTLRKLLGKVEELRRSTQAQKNANPVAPRKEELRNSTQQNELTSSKKDLRHLSVSKLGQQLDNMKEKDAMKKFWDSYKELVDEPGRKKRTLTASTTKLVPAENKTIPKSFIPEFGSPKISTGPDLLTTLPPRKEIFSLGGNNQNLASTKNLRSLIPEEPQRQSISANWKSQLKQQHRFRPEEPQPSAGNRSFGGGTSLQLNLKNLKRQMGFDDFSNNY